MLGSTEPSGDGEGPFGANETDDGLCRIHRVMIRRKDKQ